MSIDFEQLKSELAKAAEQLAEIQERLSKNGIGGVAGAVAAITAAARNENETPADMMRHDADHHAWHAMHGDPPCKSEAECAAMRAKYKDDDNTGATSATVDNVLTDGDSNG